jgi:hypothetical protein
MVEADHRRQSAYLASKRLSQYNNLATTPSTRSSFLYVESLITESNTAKYLGCKVLEYHIGANTRHTNILLPPWPSKLDIEMRRVKGTLRGLDPTLLRVKGHEASLTRPVGYPRVP